MIIEALKRARALINEYLDIQDQLENDNLAAYLGFMLNMENIYLKDVDV